MRTHLSLGILVVFASAIRLSAADDDKPLFPLDAGTKWTYQVLNQEDRFTMTAGKTEKIGDQEVVKLEARLKDQIVATEHVALKADGMYRYKFNEAAIMPEVCFLKVPAKKGEKWEQKFKTGGKEASAKFEIGEEDIEVPAGKFKAAVVVKAEVVENEVTIKSAMWFAPGHGMIKQVIDFGEQQIVLQLEKVEMPKK